MAKVNLGCGDKILPGYINVDTAVSRKGQKPDRIADITNFESLKAALGTEDSYDEILAVHVIEHIWQWEAEDTVRMWARFLKPGGMMILECPNLLHAASRMLSHPDKVGPSKEKGQETMWVLYGDPNWKDPLMCHRWGYTEESLQLLLKSAGLANVRAAPAQYKKGPPRDIRATGIKKK